MYFLGVCSYVSAMVDDLAAALDGLDTILNNRPTELAARTGSRQALVTEVRFHNEIVRYSLGRSNFTLSIRSTRRFTQAIVIVIYLP